MSLLIAAELLYALPGAVASDLKTRNKKPLDPGQQHAGKTRNKDSSRTSFFYSRHSRERGNLRVEVQTGHIGDT